MKNITTTLCALLLLLPACGGEAKKTDPTATKVTKVEAKPDAKKVDVVADPATPDKVEDAEPDPSAEKIKVAATVAKEIAADPEHADEVLDRHGLDRAKLDAMMFEIAADPSLTEAYMAARKNS